jgi:hypothetical protein
MPVPRFVLGKIDMVSVTCARCKAVLPRGDFVSKHATSCPVDCPHGCGERIGAGAYEAHKRTCTGRGTRCTAADSLHCPWEGPQVQLAAHTATCPYVLLAPLLIQINEQLTTLSARMDVIERHIGINAAPS